MARDYHDHAGATTLAKHITEYWAKQGYRVHVTLHQEAFTFQMREAYWTVRSDMINGLPRTYGRPVLI